MPMSGLCSTDGRQQFSYRELKAIFEESALPTWARGPWEACHRRSTQLAPLQQSARSRARPHCSRSRSRTLQPRGGAENVMTVRGHCRDATAKFPCLGDLQDRQLPPDFGGSRTKDLDVERHVLDIEGSPKRLHVEKARRLLIDAPKETPLARTHTILGKTLRSLAAFGGRCAIRSPPCGRSILIFAPVVFRIICPDSAGLQGPLQLASPRGPLARSCAQRLSWVVRNLATKSSVMPSGRS